MNVSSELSAAKTSLKHSGSFFFFFFTQSSQSATKLFLVSSRNAPPHWGGALRDDTKNGCVAD